MLSAHGVLRKTDSRLGGEGGVDFFHGGDEALGVIDKPACHTQGIVQHPEVAVYGNHASQGDLTPDGHQSAVEHEHHREDVGEKLEDGNVF